MKKTLLCMILCVVLVFVSMPFTAFAANGDESEVFGFEYKESTDSTGDGYIILEYAGEKKTLEDDTMVSPINEGETVKITIRAYEGSAITAVVYNGAPKAFGGTATELNMTIENYSDNNSLKITYSNMYYTCNVVSIGKGSVQLITAEGSFNSLQVPIGGSVEYKAQADEGEEILSITINGEEFDLEAYGKSETNKMEMFVNGISDITVDTDIIITFSDSSVSSVLMGDATLDNKVNIQDATAIQKAVAGLVTLSEAQATAANVDGDGRISVKDATAVQKYIAGIISEFPAGK